MAAAALPADPQLPRRRRHGGGPVFRCPSSFGFPTDRKATARSDFAQGRTGGLRGTPLTRVFLTGKKAERVLLFLSRSGAAFEDHMKKDAAGVAGAARIDQLSQRQADKLAGRLEQRAIGAALAIAQAELTRGAPDYEADPTVAVQEPVKPIGQVEMPLPVAADPSPDVQRPD